MAESCPYRPPTEVGSQRAEHHPATVAATGTARVAIGDHGLRLPRIGLGTASLGNFLGAITDEQAVDTIRRAHDAGIRYVDTAPLYGHGLAEQRVGSALRDKPREDLVISSKVGRLLRADAPRDESQYVDGKPFYTDVPATGPVWDFSYDGVRTSLAESLDRLGLDSVDILHLHDPDDHYEQAASTAYAALRDLRADGHGQGDRRRNEPHAGADQAGGELRPRRRPARRPLHPARPELHGGPAARLPRARHQGRRRRRVQQRHPAGPVATGPVRLRARRRRRSSRRHSGSRRSATATTSRSRPPRCSSRSPIRRSPASWSAPGPSRSSTWTSTCWRWPSRTRSGTTCARAGCCPTTSPSRPDRWSRACTGGCR